MNNFRIEVPSFNIVTAQRNPSLGKKTAKVPVQPKLSSDQFTTFRGAAKPKEQTAFSKFRSFLENLGLLKPDFRYGIGSEYKIPEGYVRSGGTCQQIPDPAMPGFYNNRLLAIYPKEKLKRKWIVPSTPRELPATRVKKETDQHLTNFIQSKEIEQLKAQIPSKNASVEAERAFLGQLATLIRSQFDLVENLTDEEHKQMIASITGTGKDEIVPLGEYWMKKGHGLCMPHSLLLKYVVSNIIDNPNLKASFKTGIIRPVESNFKTERNNHAWNVVTLPSGRKYRVDSVNSDESIPIPIFERENPPVESEEQIQWRKKLASFASWSHILKHGGPDLEGAFPKLSGEKKLYFEPE